MKTPQNLTHSLNVSYLVIGLVFLGISGSWALRESGVIELDEIRWLLPLMLVVAGVVGLIAFAAKGLGRRGVTPPADDSTYDPYDNDPTGELR
jgi:hypothetical protein